MNTEEHEQLSEFTQGMEWHLGIGDVSAATGVSQSQLRYWEQKGYISSEKEHGQNRKYTYAMLVRVFMIRNAMQEGFTLAAAAKRANQHKETMNLLKKAMIDRFQGIDEIDGCKAIDMGYVNQHQTERLYLVLKEDGTDIKLVPTSK
ncbi:MerR family transcriptional regulator [Secundilactobacillus folii]|uniref:MerR family transcriptional regulator n=1 Tax=Secundilactobacillus folii TaxID=2678357 RepID=A0A7X3C2R7_9LACO|nr:MerR family transcriptional regulator [Secundilactobacillus folii]MTV81752.1 MerR family transcriptional regulator [Secundilactobacillus folii]